DDLQLVTDPKDVSHGGGTFKDAEELHVSLGPIIARWLLLGALILFFLEVVLAWRFGHHTAVVGANEPPAAGKALPALAAAFALGLTAVLSFVILHAVWTGDFLSFLPDAFRRGFERLMSVPPPAPGEGSRWRLEFYPYLWDAAADPWLAGAIAVLGG